MKKVCLPIATTQDVMLANFSETFRSMKVDNTVFVFEKVGIEKKKKNKKIIINNKNRTKQKT